MEIGERIRAERRARGLSQEALARRGDVGLNVLNRIETGRTVDPHYSTLLGIARGLDVPITDLVGESAPKAQAPSPPEEEKGRRNLPPVPKTMAELVGAAGVEDEAMAELLADEDALDYAREMFESIDSHEEMLDLVRHVVRARRAIRILVDGYERELKITPQELERLKGLEMRASVVEAMAIISAREAGIAEKDLAEVAL